MYEQNENPWNDPQDSQSQQEMYHRNPEPGNASNGLAVAALICSVLSIAVSYTHLDVYKRQPGYPSPIARATLSKASPAASSLVLPRISYLP